MSEQLYTVRDIANTDEMRALYRGMPRKKREDNVSQWTRQTPDLGEVARIGHIKLFTHDQVKKVIAYAKGKDERQSKRAEKAAATRKRDQADKSVAGKLKYGVATAFVRRHPNARAGAVVEMAKKAGLVITPHLVYVTRYQDKMRAKAGKKPRVPVSMPADESMTLAESDRALRATEKAVGTVLLRMDKLDGKVNHLTALVQTLVDELAPTKPLIGKPIDGQVAVSPSQTTGSLEF